MIVKPEIAQRVAELIPTFDILGQYEREQLIWFFSKYEDVEPETLAAWFLVPDEDGATPLQMVCLHQEQLLHTMLERAFPAPA